MRHIGICGILAHEESVNSFQVRRSHIALVVLAIFIALILLGRYAFSLP